MGNDTLAVGVFVSVLFCLILCFFFLTFSALWDFSMLAISPSMARICSDMAANSARSLISSFCDSAYLAREDLTFDKHLYGMEKWWTFVVVLDYHDLKFDLSPIMFLEWRIGLIAINQSINYSINQLYQPLIQQGDDLSRQGSHHCGLHLLLTLHQITGKMKMNIRDWLTVCFLQIVSFNICLILVLSKSGDWF